MGCLSCHEGRRDSLVLNNECLETQDRAQKETGWKLVHGDVFRPLSNADLELSFKSTTMLWLWIFMRLCVGYVSARFYKMFNTTFWKKISLKMMAFTFPIVIYVIFFMLNALLWGHKSYTVFALLFLWELMLDSSSSSLRYPVKTTSLYRQISQPSCYAGRIIIGGGDLT